MCDECEWEELVELIDHMVEVEGGYYDFAMDTLEGIRKWVMENEHCTEKQRDAIENIRDAVKGFSDR